MSPDIMRWIKIVVMRTLKEKGLTRLDVNTLISAGMLGYVQSLRRFDPLRGVKFKTFAEYRIKGAVLDEVRKMIGDERCKTKRPRRVDDFDYEVVSDDGQTQTNTEGGIDLETFFENVPLSEREVEILKCRYYGMNLREISSKFGFSESRASQLLAKIKKEVYLWYRDELGANFKLMTVMCPCCQGENMVADHVIGFRCDTCDTNLVMENGAPIPEVQNETPASDEDAADVFNDDDEDVDLAIMG